MLSGLIVAGVVLHGLPKYANKTAVSPNTAAVLGTESAQATATPTLTPTSSPSSSLSPSPKPPATKRPAPKTPAPTPRRLTTVPAYTSPSPTAPYTCYTYNWSENWHIAYRYDVTPHPDGTKDVVYMGGGGTNAPIAWPFPDMCPYNQPPNYPAPTATPMYGAIYPDQSPH